jgi:hypothetical protein
VPETLKCPDCGGHVKLLETFDAMGNQPKPVLGIFDAGDIVVLIVVALIGIALGLASFFGTGK